MKCENELLRSSGDGFQVIAFPKSLYTYWYYFSITMVKEGISFKGDKKLWDRFVKRVKKNHEQVWGVLKRCIEDYLKKK